VIVGFTNPVNGEVYYGESQAKLSNFRNKMEELQYYFREKDETNQQLKYQVKHLSEKIRTSKKVCGWFVDLWC
jgi:predicted RNase H-like nuclease (RuvC/YqgF family)